MSVTQQDPLAQDDKEKLAEEQKKRIEAQLKRQKEEEQEQRRVEQNAWFFDLIGYGKVKGPGTRDSKLNAIRKEVVVDDKAQAKQQKKNVKATRFQVLYEDRLSRSKLMVEELKSYLPAAESLIKKFETSHEAAAKLLKADGEAWESAFNALHEEVSVSGAIDEADKLWKKGEEAGLKVAPKLFAGIAEMRLALQRAAGLLTPEAIERLSAGLDAAEAPLHRLPKPGKDDITAANKQLNLVEGAIDTEAKTANVVRGRAVKLESEVTTLLKNAARLAREGNLPGYTDTIAATFNTQLNAAKTNIGLHDFVVAEDLLLDLKILIETRCDDLADRYETAKRGWASAKLEFITIMDQADKIAKTVGLPPAIVDAAGRLNERVAKLVGVTPGADPTFEAAVAEANAVRAELKSLKDAVAGAPQLARETVVADQRVRQLMDANAKAIIALVNAMETAHGGALDPGMVISPFEERLLAITQEWEGLLASAVDVKGLDEGSITADLTGLLLDINRAAGPGVDDAVSDIVLAPARTKFAIARARAMDVALGVLNINAQDGAELVETIEELEITADNADTPEQIEGLTASLEELIKVNLIRANNSGTGIAQFQRMLADKLKEIAPLLVELKNKVNGIGDGATQKPFVKLLDTLQTEFLTLEAVSTSQQRALLEQSLDEADALVKEIADAGLAIDKTAKGTDAHTFKAATRLLAGYAKRLAKTDVQTCVLSTATELGEKCKALEKGFGDTTLTELFRQIAAIGLLIDAVELKAGAAETAVATFETGIDVQKTRLGKEPFKTVAPDYATATIGRLNAILSDAKFEDGLKGAEIDLARLTRELDDMLASPTNLLGQNVDLVDQQDRAVEAKRKGELDEAKWKGEFDVVEKMLAAAKGGDVDSDEIAGLKTTLANTKKAIDKSKQFADGRDQLKAIRTRLGLLEANPYGLVISSRNRLPQTVARVKGAILDFGKGLAQVKTELDKVPTTDLDDTGKKAVIAQLAAVRGLFNPAAFTKSVPLVAAPDTVPAKRQAAREVALRDVRRMMVYVDTDYRIKALASTPYKNDMAGVVSALKLGLLDLENNLLVSMPRT